MGNETNKVDASAANRIEYSEDLGEGGHEAEYAAQASTVATIRKVAERLHHSQVDENVRLTETSRAARVSKRHKTHSGTPNVHPQQGK